MNDDALSFADGALIALVAITVLLIVGLVVPLIGAELAHYCVWAWEVTG